MKTKIMGVVTVVLVLGTGVFGDIVELPLNCAGTYDINTSAWTSNFDLGVTFSEISQVYIDWSGEIMAELVVPCGLPPDKASPIDALFVSKLYESDPHDYFARVSIQAGGATWPQAEPFDIQSAFTNEGWSMLLDGRAGIEIDLSGVHRPMNLCTVKYPSGNLDSATLVIEGTVVPEPTMLSLLVIGFVAVRARHHRPSLR